MNSHLTRIALANDIHILPAWKHALADSIGAPAVYYRFKTARIEGNTMWVDDPADHRWIMDRHSRELAKSLGVTKVLHAGGMPAA